MIKTYEIRGRNPLRINDDDQGEHYKYHRLWICR